MVYCQELKCWCRAVIKSIVSSADHYLTECFLVDFAKYVPVKSEKYVCMYLSCLMLFRGQTSVFKENVNFRSKGRELQDGKTCRFQFYKQ